VITRKIGNISILLKTKMNMSTISGTVTEIDKKKDFQLNPESLDIVGACCLLYAY
jgi:hypothetical protein